MVAYSGMKSAMCEGNLNNAITTTQQFDLNTTIVPNKRLKLGCKDFIGML